MSVWRRYRERVARHQAVQLIVDHRLAAILLLTGILAYMVILSVVLTLRASGHLERGRSALIQAREEIARGSAQAASNFEAARSEFEAAQAGMDNVFVSIAASIPLIGRTPDAIRTAAEAGLLVTDAGRDAQLRRAPPQRGFGVTVAFREADPRRGAREVPAGDRRCPF